MSFETMAMQRLYGRRTPGGFVYWLPDDPITLLSMDDHDCLCRYVEAKILKGRRPPNYINPPGS